MEKRFDLILGDCIEKMRELPAGSVDKIILITDPPYGINLDSSWLSGVNARKGTPVNVCDNKLINDTPNAIDLTFLFEFKHRLIFGHPYIYDKNATGWIVWDKQPKIAERCITAPVEVASTTLRRGYDVIRCMWGGYMRDADRGEIRYEHPTQKPLKLMSRIIEKFTDEGDTILDPFMGSGTTGVACMNLNRKFIGMEIDAEYFKIAEKRISEAAKQEKLGGF
jgi:site-specific DNA-methyltransferase (adenine-specific)